MFYCDLLFTRRLSCSNLKCILSSLWPQINVFLSFYSWNLQHFHSRIKYASIRSEQNLCEIFRPFLSTFWAHFAFISTYYTRTILISNFEGRFWTNSDFSFIFTLELILLLSSFLAYTFSLSTTRPCLLFVYICWSFLWYRTVSDDFLDYFY